MAIEVGKAQATWEGPLASGTRLIRMGGGAAGSVPTIASHLEVTARVPGLVPDSFDAVIGEASELCPVSRLFAGAKIIIDATLEPRP